MNSRTIPSALPWKSQADVLAYARNNPGNSRRGAANPASLSRECARLPVPANAEVKTA